MFETIPEKEPFLAQSTPVKQPSLGVFTPQKQPCVVKNCFGNDTCATPINPFDDLFEESPVQQQAQPQMPTPKPNLQEQEFLKKESKQIIYGGPEAPVWSRKHPPRSGPSIWWQKQSHEMDEVTRWHRTHPLSPAFKVGNIDNSRKKEEPRKPSHGRSEPWYVDND